MKEPLFAGEPCPGVPNLFGVSESGIILETRQLPVSWELLLGIRALNFERTHTMIAAFFDLDGTLCTEHVWRAFSKYFTEHRRRRLLFNAFLAAHLSLWPLHRLDLLSRARLFRWWIEHMPWLLVGLRPEQGQEIFRWVTDQALIPSLRPDVAEVLRQHQAEGHQVILVSGAFEELLTYLGERLGIQHVVGTGLELRA